MKFSVIMPCYNAGPWIAQALRSAASQTHAPHEIIVIDDASTDDSIEQIDKSGVDVRLLHTRRANGAGARNAGIEAATGDWVAYLDADDYWYDDHLERVADLIAPTDAGYLGVHDYLYEGRDEPSPTPNPWPIDRPTAGLPDQRLPELWRHAWHYAMTTVCVRLDALRAAGGFDTALVRRHDFDMFLRVVGGRTWAYDPVPCAVYRADNAGSISRVNWASSERYHLRGLVKNLPAYPGLEHVIPPCARRVVASAITDGSAEDRRLARQEAWGFLPPGSRPVLALGLAVPWLFRALNRSRRKRRRVANARRGGREVVDLAWLDKKPQA